MPSFVSRGANNFSPSALRSSSTLPFGIPTAPMPYVPHASVVPPAEKSGYDFADQYGQASVFAASCSLMYPGQPLQAPTYNGFPPTALQHAAQGYGPIAAPVLPPIRVHGRAPDQPSTAGPHASHGRSQKAGGKDEKSIGGVAVHLDYEMDQMTDYVAEMAQGLVQPGSSVQAAFRKFVSQILSSTRLPSSTILLALFYLSTRMGMLARGGQHKTSSGSVYRLLTVALLLGSKFLDDNTFQNRSWSEVTGLAVRELNSLELEWLRAIQWNLHIDPNEAQGFTAWREHWMSWKGKDAAMKLVPLNTNVQRPRDTFKNYSAAPAYVPQYGKPAVHGPENQAVPYGQRPAAYDPGAWGYRSNMERSPSSAPGTGPTTPDYYGGWPSHAPPPYSARPHGPYPSQPPSYHQTATYGPQYTPSVWHHGAGCGCNQCVRNDGYFPAGSYGPQTVMG